MKAAKLVSSRAFIYYRAREHRERRSLCAFEVSRILALSFETTYTVGERFRCSVCTKPSLQRRSLCPSGGREYPESFRKKKNEFRNWRTRVTTFPKRETLSPHSNGNSALLSLCYLPFLFIFFPYTGSCERRPLVTRVAALQNSYRCAPTDGGFSPLTAISGLVRGMRISVNISDARDSIASAI